MRQSLPRDIAIWIDDLIRSREFDHIPTPILRGYFIDSFKEDFVEHQEELFGDVLETIKKEQSSIVTLKIPYLKLKGSSCFISFCQETITDYIKEKLSQDPQIQRELRRKNLRAYISFEIPNPLDIISFHEKIHGEIAEHEQFEITVILEKRDAIVKGN